MWPDSAVIFLSLFWSVLWLGVGLAIGYFIGLGSSRRRP